MPKFSVTDKSQFCLVIYLQGRKIRNSAAIKDKTINSLRILQKTHEEKEMRKRICIACTIIPIQTKD